MSEAIPNTQTTSRRTKGPRKHKTEVVGILLAGGGIKYATDHDRETMKGVPVGTPIAMRPFGNDRSLAHHKKLWKLLELGYQYWEPAWSFVSAPESWIAQAVAKELATAAGDPSLYENVTKGIAESVLARLADQRQKRFDAEAVKTDEAYLNHIMVKAGFYDLAANPEGGTYKQRWSIAFANMDQENFSVVYRGVSGAIWNETLQYHFSDEAEMEAAVNQLLSF